MINEEKYKEYNRVGRELENIDSELSEVVNEFCSGLNLMFNSVEVLLDPLDSYKSTVKLNLSDYEIKGEFTVRSKVDNLMSVLFKFE